MGGGQAGGRDLIDPVVADTDQADILRDASAGLAEGRQGAHGHGVCRADKAVDLRAGRQQAFHGLAAAPGVEGAGLIEHGSRVDPRVQQGLFGSAPAVEARRDVPVRRPDHGDPVAAARQEQAGQVPHGVKVVVKDTGQALEVLAGDHDRHAAAADSLRDLRRKDGSHQDNSGDLALLHEVQVAVFLLRVMVRAAEQGHVAFLKELLCGTRRDAADRIGVQAGDNDPHLVDPAGAHGLGHGIGPVAGLLDGLFDQGAFFLAEGSSIQISADRCGRDSRQCGNFFNGHAWLPFFAPVRRTVVIFSGGAGVFFVVVFFAVDFFAVVVFLATGVFFASAGASSAAGVFFSAFFSAGLSAAFSASFAAG